MRSARTRRPTTWRGRWSTRATTGDPGWGRSPSGRSPIRPGSRTRSKCTGQSRTPTARPAPRTRRCADYSSSPSGRPTEGGPMELRGKRAMVTGAGSGIGRACALRLAEAGAAVAAVDVRPEAAADVVSAIERAGGKGLAVNADVTSRAAVDAAVGRIATELGGVDVLLNCAGGSLTSRFVDLEEEEWDRVVDLNLKAAYLCARPVARLMIARGSGRIINVSSNYGVTGSAPRVHYSAAKAGIIGFTKALAL